MVDTYMATCIIYYELIAHMVGLHSRHFSIQSFYHVILLNYSATQLLLYFKNVFINLFLLVSLFSLQLLLIAYNQLY